MSLETRCRIVGINDEQCSPKKDPKTLEIYLNKRNFI